MALGLGDKKFSTDRLPLNIRDKIGDIIKLFGEAGTMTPEWGMWLDIVTTEIEKTLDKLDKCQLGSVVDPFMFVGGAFRELFYNWSEEIEVVGQQIRRKKYNKAQEIYRELVKELDNEVYSKMTKCGCGKKGR